jgi:hypothetical protein
MSGQRYNAKKAYDKDLTASARLHYLENSEHDKSVSRRSSSPLDASIKYNEGHDPVRLEASGKRKEGISRKSSPTNFTGEVAAAGAAAAAADTGDELGKPTRSKPSSKPTTKPSSKPKKG